MKKYLAIPVLSAERALDVALDRKPVRTAPGAEGVANAVLRFFTPDRIALLEADRGKFKLRLEERYNVRVAAQE